MKRDGFTLIEMLVVMAIVGVLLAITITGFGQPRPRDLANNIQAELQRDRFEAIKQNRPVAFVWDDTNQKFTTRVKASTTAAQSCAQQTGDTVLGDIPLTGIPRVSVPLATITFPADTVNSSLRGLLWQPSGLPTKCGGAALTASEFVINRVDGTKSTPVVKVAVGPAGRIGQQ